MNKYILYIFFLSLLVVALFAGCSSMKATDLLNSVLPASHYHKQTVANGNLPRQSMDIYLPNKDTGKNPIVFVYGGAWREGSKEDYEFVAHALTGLGHPVVIPDYRLYPEVRFPAFVDDIADAIGHLNKNHQQFLGSNTFNKYILMGHSSGAHTAALLATDLHYLKQRGVSAQLAGLIAMAGPYDLPLDDDEVIPVFTNNGKLARASKVKPVLNVHPYMPPILLLHGADDERVFPLHTKRFDIALRESGNSPETHIYPGVNHTRLIGALAAPLRFLNNSYEDIKKFLARI